MVCVQDGGNRIQAGILLLIVLKTQLSDCPLFQRRKTRCSNNTLTSLFHISFHSFRATAYDLFLCRLSCFMFLLHFINFFYAIRVYNFCILLFLEPMCCWSNNALLDYLVVRVMWCRNNRMAPSKQQKVHTDVPVKGNRVNWKISLWFCGLIVASQCDKRQNVFSTVWWGLFY